MLPVFFDVIYWIGSLSVISSACFSTEVDPEEGLLCRENLVVKKRCVFDFSCCSNTDAVYSHTSYKKNHQSHWKGSHFAIGVFRNHQLIWITQVVLLTFYNVLELISDSFDWKRTKHLVLISGRIVKSSFAMEGFFSKIIVQWNLSVLPDVLKSKSGVVLQLQIMYRYLETVHPYNNIYPIRWGRFLKIEISTLLHEF